MGSSINCYTVEVNKEVKDEKEFKQDFRLTSQITSTTVSIPSNIAEGNEQNKVKQSINYFYIANGSLAQLITLSIIACVIGSMNIENSEKLITRAKMIQARKNWTNEKPICSH